MSASRVAQLARIVLAQIVLAGTSASASAAPLDAQDCAQWQVPALMELVQWDTRGTRVQLKLQQDGIRLHGWAQYQSTHGPVLGNVSGDIGSNSIHLRILWTYSGQPSIGNYTGTITPRTGAPAGSPLTGFVFAGRAYDELGSTPEPTSWNSPHFDCRVDPPRPVVALGRVKIPASGPPMPICDAARSAKARNSPAAAGLEQQCLASGGSMRAPLLSDALASSAHDRVRAELSPIAEQAVAPSPLPDVSAAQIDALAATGADIAQHDPGVANARANNIDASYARGFDIGTGLFGDPALGALGNTATGPGSLAIRATLDALGQRGFNDSVAFHLARVYQH